LRAARELAVEFGEQRHAVDEAQFRAGRSERTSSVRVSPDKEKQT
jgi:hypothetical protein